MKAPGLQNNKWVILNLLLLAGILAFSIYRDIQLDKQYPADLRNRVVGARLQKDGKLPYFFHWQKADYPRYADPYNAQDTTLPASNITASPFFHQLLIPFCEIPQRTFSALWLILQYLLLAGMCWMFSFFAKTTYQKLLLLNVTVLFTLTAAWKCHIAEGQLYFIEAFLMAVVICALLYNKKQSWIFAGIAAAMLVLTRPIALVIFIPFLFQFRKYACFLISSWAALALYGLFVLSSHYETALWKQYQLALKKHVELHQYGDPNQLFLWGGPAIPYIEGFDLKQAAVNLKEHPIEISTESGNFYILYKNILHKKMPLKVLNALNLVSLLVLSGLFFYFGRKHPFQIHQVILAAFLLYMLEELFSPVERHQYNVVQWLPLLLPGFLALRSGIHWKDPVFLLLLTGLLLTITNFSKIYDRNTLAEFAWFAALLLIVFNSKPTNLTLWKQPSSWAPDRRD